MSHRIPSRPWAILLLLSAMLVSAGTTAAQEPTQETAQEPAEKTAESPTVRAEALLERIGRAKETIRKLEERFASATGEQAQLLARRLGRERMKGFEDVQKLTQWLIEQKAAGNDVSAIEARVVPILEDIETAVDQLADHRRRLLVELADKRDAASAAEQPVLERRMDRELEQGDELYQAYLKHIENMEALGLDARSERADLSDRLIDRSETLSVRVEMAVEDKKDIEARVKELPSDADLIALLRAARARLAGSIRSLGVTLDLMDEMGLETAEHRNLLIEAQGRLTTDILDTGVVMSLIRKWTASARKWIVANGPGVLFKVLLLAAILFAFRLLARIAREIARKAISSSKLNFTQLLKDMIVNTIGNAVMVIGLMVALSQLGISLGPLLAGLGIAGFVLGFALQDSLSNFAAGMMILLYRPYDIGDLIEAVGVFGKVNKMSLVSTTILTLDHQTLIVPNAKIWGDVIKNVTAQDIRRVDLTFGISYGDDVAQAEEILASIVAAHDKVLPDPQPMIKLHELGDSSVNFVVRPWVKTEDYWDVYWDITREVKLRFDANGVTIPFPQRDVHLHTEPTSDPGATGSSGS